MYKGPDKRSSRPLTGYAALRLAVAAVLAEETLLSSKASPSREGPPSPRQGSGAPDDDAPDDNAEASRLVALVDLARRGDAEAFGALYDHYSPAVYRFVYYRVNSQVLAEDLTSETFFRALRSVSKFTWQGKNFGAWLTTIARNLIADHYKSSRARLEITTDDFTGHEQTSAAPEDEVLQAATNSILRQALTKLPAEQQECLVLRFLNGSSISETAEAMGRSAGAVKQLQLRAVRSLAKQLPEGLL